MLKPFRACRAAIAWPTLLSVVLYLNACVGYSAHDMPKDEPLRVDPGKELVAHVDGRAFALQAPTVGKAGLTARARSVFSKNRGMDILPPKSQRIDLYLSPGGDFLADGSDAFLPWSRVQRITVYDVSVGKTILFWTVATMSAVAVAFLIFLLLKTSCPFVYADAGGGSGYAFQGEIFSGAVYPQLERRDWLPLPDPQGSDYRLRIANEVKEIQHIDLAQLWIARHPAGTGVLLDGAGRPHTYEAPMAPARCATTGGRDALPWVAARDTLAYLGGDGDGKNGWSDGLDMVFPKPAGARAGKLLLRAKNSFWLDYTYGQFQDLFGESLERWNGKMRQAPRDKLEAWFRGQQLPLAVEAKGPGGWHRVADLPLPGPMAARDFVIPFEAPPGDSLAIRLRCGFMFWEIDYAAMDYSPDRPVEMLAVDAAAAADQHGRDLRAVLASGDGVRYDQPAVGDAAVLRFAIPPAPAGMAQAAFLATQGYYDILRSPRGRPRTARLKAFRDPGALSRFSSERMRDQIGGDPRAF